MCRENMLEHLTKGFMCASLSFRYFIFTTAGQRDRHTQVLEAGKAITCAANHKQKFLWRDPRRSVRLTFVISCRAFEYCRELADGWIMRVRQPRWAIGAGSVKYWRRLFLHACRPRNADCLGPRSGVTHVKSRANQGGNVESH